MNAKQARITKLNILPHGGIRIQARHLSQTGRKMSYSRSHMTRRKVRVKVMLYLSVLYQLGIIYNIGDILQIGRIIMHYLCLIREIVP